MKRLNVASISLIAGATLLASIAVFSQEVLPKTVPVPENNPITPAKIKLGRMLYFDSRLSADNSISCNSCHQVDGGKAGHDGKRTSPGVKGQLGGRNSPTVYNAAFYSVQFWDGRAATLEDQAKGPITNPIEMGMPDHDAVVRKIQSIAGYAEPFEKAFPKEKNPINIDNIAKAIATYERTLVTPSSPVDQHLAGKKKSLSASAIRGMKLVQSVGCMSCHNGPNYAGPALPLGTGFYMKFPTIAGTDYDKKYGFSKDLGRFEVTKNEADKHFFRVASWRNVARTGPYFHNGSVDTLDEAVRVMAKTQLNQDLSENQVTDIVAFLNGLNGKLPQEAAPVLPQ